MSTRATIATIDENGTIKSIYNHWSGYPARLGVILSTFFNDKKSIEVLMESAISHFDVNDDQVVIHRIGEEEENLPEIYFRMKDLVKNSEEYLYLFKNGKWYVKEIEARSFKELDKVLERLEKQKKK